VYRTLVALADAGEIDVMHTAGGENLYRRCSDGHLTTLVCRSCGRTVEVLGPAVETWADKVAAAARVHGREPHIGDLRYVSRLCGMIPV
jgi:Fur family ferric uptake transcriptional regulator